MRPRSLEIGFRKQEDHQVYVEHGESKAKPYKRPPGVCAIFDHETSDQWPDGGSSSNQGDVSSEGDIICLCRKSGTRPYMNIIVPRSCTKKISAMISGTRLCIMILLIPSSVMLKDILSPHLSRSSSKSKDISCC